MGLYGDAIKNYKVVMKNADKIQGSNIDNVPPTFENIANKSYPVSRPLYFYVKQAHVDVIPGIREYVAEFTSDEAWGPDGYLSERGMIPMPDEERAKFGSNGKNMTVMTSR